MRDRPRRRSNQYNTTTGYEEMKMLIQDRTSWRQGRWKPAILAEYYRERERERERERCNSVADPRI